MTDLAPPGLPRGPFLPLIPLLDPYPRVTSGSMFGGMKAFGVGAGTMLIASSRRIGGTTGAGDGGWDLTGDMGGMIGMGAAS